MAQNSHGQRHDRTALVLYGSETGNSQDVAEELGRMAEKLHFVTSVCEMDLVEIVRRHSRSVQSWVKSMRLCIQPIEPSPAIHRSHICHLDNRTGRVSEKCKEVLEKSSEETFASWMPGSRGFHHLRSRR